MIPFEIQQSTHYKDSGEAPIDSCNNPASGSLRMLNTTILNSYWPVGSANAALTCELRRVIANCSWTKYIKNVNFSRTVISGQVIYELQFKLQRPA